MINHQDVRWKQRFSNYQNAYQALMNAVAITRSRGLTDLEKQGLIQGFEYTHELAWNVLKDYLEFYGHAGLIGSRDTTREAFKRGLIEDGDVWMQMIQSRNLTSHAYNPAMAEKIQADILTQFSPAFTSFTARFAALGAGE